MRMVRSVKNFILPIIILFTFTNLIAGDRPGLAFLNSEMSARGASLAGAMVAKRGEIHGLFHNPASLSGLKGTAWSANYVNHLLDIGGGNFMLAKEFNSGNVGFGLASIEYGSFDRIDDRGTDLGTDFSASDLIVSLGFSREISGVLSIGTNIKWANSSIDRYSSNAIALDAGFIYYQAERDLSIGGGIFNLGKSTAFIVNNDPLPTSFRIGISKLLAHLPLRVNAEGIWLTYGNWKALGSGEIILSPNVNLIVGLSSNRLDLDTSSLSEDFYSGGNIGLGIMVDKWRIDYALSSYGGAGLIQRFGLSSNF